jgi:maleamate amidohydrolase
MTLGFTDPASPLACDLEGPGRGPREHREAPRRGQGGRRPRRLYHRRLQRRARLTAAAFIDKVPALLTLEAGSRWAEIEPRIAPRTSEPVLNKLFASGYFGTPLGALVTAAGVDTLLVTGASTSGCDRATAVDVPPARLQAYRPARGRGRPRPRRPRGEPPRHRRQVRGRGGGTRRARVPARARGRRVTLRSENPRKGAYGRRGSAARVGALTEPTQGRLGVIEDGDVSIVRVQPQFGSGAAAREPLAVRGRHDPVPAAVHQEGR